MTPKQKFERICEEIHRLEFFSIEIVIPAIKTRVNNMKATDVEWIDGVYAYLFGTNADRDVIIEQLKEDLKDDNNTIGPRSSQTN